VQAFGLEVTAMPEIIFTSHLGNVAPEEPIAVEADSIISGLNEVFAHYPKLRRYILDDQGLLRRAIRIYVDGRQLVSGKDLHLQIGPTTRVHVY
jgi:hypothetical protein